MPTTYSPDELTQMLVAGAKAIDRINIAAAVHLITFTSLPHRPAFAELVVMEDVDGPDAGAPAAVVRWKELPGSKAVDRLGGADTRLMALAVSLAAGEPVDLAATIAVGGYAYARRVIEAIAIATGYGAYYDITPTAELARIIADRDALLNSQDAGRDHRSWFRHVRRPQHRPAATSATRTGGHRPRVVDRARHPADAPTLRWSAECGWSPVTR